MELLRCPHCGEPIPPELIASHLGKMGGSKSTPAKRRASRLNGLKGGRPPKKGKGREKKT
ncbi:MAG TPA: hypothetical protein VLV83_26195 [Acidobacteriota bacterium]|nr:hypothetical protein [Acidobacteriota bacterium]